MKKETNFSKEAIKITAMKYFIPLGYRLETDSPNLMIYGKKQFNWILFLVGLPILFFIFPWAALIGFPLYLVYYMAMPVKTYTVEIRDGEVESQCTGFLNELS